MNKKSWKQYAISGIILFFLIASIFGSYYLFKDGVEGMEEDCKDCKSKECMDYDRLCGDFGLYYWQLLGGVIGFTVPIMVIIVVFFRYDESKEYSDNNKNNGKGGYRE